MRIDSTYQLNTGGNTDFLNMLGRERLASKKVSKTEAVQSQLESPLEPDQIHVGPSDFVPFLKDNKVCYLRLEGTGFGGVPLNIEVRLERGGFAQQRRLGGGCDSLLQDGTGSRRRRRAEGAQRLDDEASAGADARCGRAGGDAFNGMGDEAKDRGLIPGA